MAVAQRVYAKALFEAAKEKDRLAPVQQELDEFVEVQRDVPELRELLRNPRVERQAKANALQEIAGSEDELFKNFLLLLAEKGRGAEIDEIAREFDRLVAEDQHILDVELTTAVRLSDQEAEKLVGQIEKASGRKVEATRKVDPDLIGGLVLQVGSLRLDASVRGRLNHLRQELRSAT
jgi:F-type H+-transporting ATPase subunit delta